MLRPHWWWLWLIFSPWVVALAAQPTTEQPEGRRVEIWSNMTSEAMAPAASHSRVLLHYPQLKVGLFCCSAAPLQMMRWDGKLEGLYPDYLRLLSVVLKRPLEARLYNSWPQAYQALQRGDIQLLAQSDFAVADANNNRTDPILVQPLMLMVRKSNQNTPLAELHIVTAPDINPTLLERLRSRYPQLTVAGSPQQGVQAVISHQADAWLDGQSQIAWYSAQRPLSGLVYRRDAQLDELLYGFVGRQGDGVVETVNAILTSIPHAIKNEIYQRWISGLAQGYHSNGPQFSQQEIDWIKQHPVINVAVDTDTPPYSFLNKNDEITGLDIDILQLLAEKNGLNFNFISASGPPQVEKILRAEKAQMTPSLMDSQARRGWLTFSDPWGAIEWVMITRNERSAPFTLQQLSHKRVAIQRGHALLSAMQFYPQMSIVEATTVPEAVDMMLAGAVDATFASIGSASYLQSSRYGNRIIVQTLDNALQPERFAVLPAYPQLTSILNKGIASLSPNELRALKIHWFSVANLTSYNSQLPPWVMLWGVALLVIAVSSIFWVSYLARQISRRKKAEYRLQELLAYWEILFNNVPTPMFVCAADMSVTAANQHFCQATGLRGQEVLGHDLFTLHFLPVADKQEVRGIFLRCLSGDAAHFSDRTLHLQGKEREGYLWFEGYRNPAGVMLGVIGGWFDVTERKSLARELLLARDKAELASQEKSAFLARMSHEIRTPLHAIIGILELAVKQQPEQDNPLRIAWQAADSLQGIIGDVLDFSKIEAGSIDIRLQPTRLESLLESCAATFRLRAEEKGLTLQTLMRLPAETAHWVDGARLTQVVNNLLLNAIKFTAKGGIQLRASGRFLRSEDRDEVTIEVEDSGCGIPPEMYQAVLQPWVRAESADAVPGSGLGLPISARLINLMGGTLTPGASASGGVRISIVLSLQRAGPELLANPALPGSGQQVESESLNILVVDDLPVNLQVMALQFASSGHYVELVGSGAEALQEVEQHYYDVVLTDCQMQGMDGYSLTRHLREYQQRHQLPPLVILGCTANAFASERERCLAAGMDDVLIKPLSQQALLNGVAQAWKQVNQRSVAIADEPLRALAQGDTQQERQLLTALQQGLQQDMAAIRQMRDGDNIAQITRHAHRMQASFALLYDHPGMRVCLRIEKSGRVDRQTLDTLLERAEIVLAKLAQRVSP
ncbi:transporter substrate-binding domain-containing protein [Erwiniaceae bacterium BAC15a-03b]|uniref:histidine kinase n=1 Tax=Winslowiella arboricola TaxID=2978220 RepID=A0A9J6PND5_9GAMM|nr:transporter substrate-binding domain-containing protein [Winslowiella arboricola]MCU5772728.1 transporter substrate-binding domain-containing protein [Winslowiella arboricola]MCU5778278.1 transporter substrate-binding domain-containing protein [Winslowiella arboricola]